MSLNKFAAFGVPPPAPGTRASLSDRLSTVIAANDPSGDLQALGTSLGTSLLPLNQSAKLQALTDTVGGLDSTLATALGSLSTLQQLTDAVTALGGTLATGLAPLGQFDAVTSAVNSVATELRTGLQTLDTSVDELAGKVADGNPVSVLDAIKAELVTLNTKVAANNPNVKLGELATGIAAVTTEVKCLIAEIKELTKAVCHACKEMTEMMKHKPGDDDNGSNPPGPKRKQDK